MIKKIILSIGFSLMTSFSFSSCNFGKNIDEFWDEKINIFVNYMENHDTNGITDMFAKNKISDLDSFNKSLNDLYSYFNENIHRIIRIGGRGEDDDKNLNYRAHWYNIPYKIQTQNSTYHIAFYWCTKYIVDNKTVKDEEGIWSFYIINENEYDTPEYTYRGDGNWTPGINVGKQREQNLLCGVAI